VTLASRLGYAKRAAGLVVTDPAGSLSRFRSKLDKRRDRRAWEALGAGPQELYKATDDWQPRLHDLLGADWPCADRAVFQTIWSDAIAALRPEAHASDDEPDLAHTTRLEQDFDAASSVAEAAFCLVRHLRPEYVVETGVARGITSRFVLEALEQNGTGRLWSIDLPHPDTVLHHQIGVAVPDSLRDRWTLLLGTSRARLSPVLRELGEVDLFIHDSLHTERNVLFELDAVWPALRAGGAVLVDDVDWSLAFHRFTQRPGVSSWLVGQRREDRGLWGLAVKGP
jgi:predicted O-methyltransferase YrrM